MSVKFEETATNEGVLHFTVSKEDAQKALKQAYNRVKGKVNIPGFRKGKVSYPVFVKMIGEEALYEDALNYALPQAYANAVKEADLDVVGQPKFDVEKMHKGGSWELKAEVATKPSVSLGDYKDLTVDKQDREVTDEDVDNRLKQAQENLAELSIKEGEAQEGDTVVIDYEGSVDGENFAGGSAENHSLELGSNSFIPGFEDQLVGSKSGDEVEVKVTFPEEYHAEDLAGQDAIFKVKVHEVKEKSVPELDDEFAKDVDDEVESLDELKAKYRDQLQEAKDQQADEQVEDQAIRQAVDNVDFSSVPQAMIDEEVNRQLDHYLNEMQRQGISPEMFYQLTGTSEEDLRQQFAEDADTRVKTNLLLEQIIAEENIEVSEEDIAKEIENLAETYNMEVEAVKNVVTEDMLKHDIELKQAMNLITSTAKEK